MGKHRCKKTIENRRKRRVCTRWLVEKGHIQSSDMTNSEMARLVSSLGLGIKTTKGTVVNELYWYIDSGFVKKNHGYTGKDFYSSKEWRKVRIDALVKNGRRCCVCGRSAKHGIVLHVDHIKPRSKYRELQLELSNLQILCEDCNLGKSNRYSEDWRG